MSAWPPRFLFLSDRPSIDLAHTGRRGSPAEWERLPLPADLVDWLAASTLQLHVREVTDEEHAAARALREPMWSAIDAVLAGAELPRRAVRALHEHAARPDLVPVLTRGRTGWARTSTASQALSSIARDAIALFGSSWRERIRKCRNPRCSIVFVDTSRPGKRAWCAMRRCGNLAKIARYRKGRDTP